MRVDQIRKGTTYVGRNGLERTVIEIKGKEVLYKPVGEDFMLRSTLTGFAYFALCRSAEQERLNPWQFLDVRTHRSKSK